MLYIITKQCIVNPSLYSHDRDKVYFYETNKKSVSGLANAKILNVVDGRLSGTLRYPLINYAMEFQVENLGAAYKCRQVSGNFHLISSKRLLVRSNDADSPPHQRLGEHFGSCHEKEQTPNLECGTAHTIVCLLIACRPKGWLWCNLIAKWHLWQAWSDLQYLSSTIATLYLYLKDLFPTIERTH